MGLAEIIRRGIATADKITGGTDGVQDEIEIYRWTGIGDFGEPIFTPTALVEKAIVEEKEAQRRLSSGVEVTQKAQVTIPRPIAAHGAAHRREPIDPRDQIILPSGYSGPILDVAGLTDPKTHAPFMFVIILG